mgnify:CR=1 FL=1
MSYLEKILSEEILSIKSLLENTLKELETKS